MSDTLRFFSIALIMQRNVPDQLPVELQQILTKRKIWDTHDMNLRDSKTSVSVLRWASLVRIAIEDNEDEGSVGVTKKGLTFFWLMTERCRSWSYVI